MSRKLKYIQELIGGVQNYPDIINYPDDDSKGILHWKKHEFISSGFEYITYLPQFKFDEKRFNQQLDELVNKLVYYTDFIKKIKKQLSNDNFVANAPSHIVEIERKKLIDAEQNLEMIERQISNL